MIELPQYLHKERRCVRVIPSAMMLQVRSMLILCIILQVMQLLMVLPLTLSR